MHNLHVSGATALDGSKWIIVTCGDTRELLQAAKPKGWLNQLAAVGIIPPDRGKVLKARIGDISEWPAMPLATSAGWVDDNYVLPDGTVLRSNAESALELASAYKVVQPL